MQDLSISVNPPLASAASPRATPVVWAYVGLFWCGVAVVLGALTVVFRSGLAFPGTLFFTCLSLLAVTALLPSALASWRHPLLDRSAYLVPLSGAAVLFSPILALWVGPGVKYVYTLLAAILLPVAIVRVRGCSRRSLWFLVYGAPAAALYLFLAVNNQNVVNLYVPEQAYLGLLNHDTTLHLAVANMVTRFGLPSLGLDGLLPITYHTGSHFWFAGLAVAGGSLPLYAYPFATLLVSIPALFLALSMSVVFLRPERPAPSIGIILALLFVVDVVSAGWTSYYISESYTLALAGLLFMLPLLLARAQRESGADALRANAIALAAVVLLSWFKISVGLLWGIGVGYLALRSPGGRMRTLILLLVLAGLALFCIKSFTLSTADYHPQSGRLISFLYFFRAFPGMPSLASFLLPAGVVVVAAHVFGSLRQAIRERRGLYVETVVVITVVGALPAALGVPQESAVWYFLNVAQWFAFPWLAAAIAPEAVCAGVRDLLHSATGKVIALLAGAVAAFHLQAALTPGFLEIGRNLLRTAHAQSGRTLLEYDSPDRYFKHSLAGEHTLFGATFREALERSPGAGLVRATSGIAARKDRIAVFIPPENSAFWKFPIGCRSLFNLQPALSGQPSLFGSPPAETGCERDVYTEVYGTDIASRALDHSALCARARQRAIAYVLILRDLNDLAANRELDCRLN
jgi:hypothetical protein